MDMSKVTIINCFDTYEHRVDLVRNVFNLLDYDVLVIQSNFKHLKKEYRVEEKKGYLFLKTKAYRKNLSIARLLSHYFFSKKACSLLSEKKPDIIYILVPPNILTKYATVYKQTHKNVKLIFDIIDLWPETMPINKYKNFVIFKFWGNIRNKNLKYADLIITECDYYRLVLSSFLQNLNVKTLFMAKKNVNFVCKMNSIENVINLVYLGSINNLVDISIIKLIVSAIDKFIPVVLHIIGDGEKKSELIFEVKKSGATVKDYGVVHDEKEKQRIFNFCHFGLNIMKKSVCVGLTMKSVDYFQHGVPIINNIPGDTESIVKKFNVGVNITNDISQLEKEITHNFVMSNRIMKTNCLSLFKENFSEESFNKSLMNYLNSIL